MNAHIFRCDCCGALRTYGCTHAPRPESTEVILLCDNNCKGQKVHTPHSYAYSRPEPRN